MRLVLALIFLLISFPAYADSNAIKMGYNFVTVSQNVVFNNTMRAGGTLSLSASVADGGGRNPGDPFTMKLVFYNSSNAIISTVQQAWTLVLGANPATYSISATNCGGSCSNVSYVSVQFYGKDGGYWAGNYGPYIRDPVLSMNGGGNILYNPDFGIYNGNVYAQGWSSSNGWQSCQLYSGTNTCVINYNAAVNGGNYSAFGGTTSGTAGGYTSAPPAPTYPTATVSATQTTKMNQVNTVGHNSVYVDNYGNYTSVNIEQKSDYNVIRGINGAQYMLINGDHNSTTINQGSATTLVGQNLAEVSIIGANNALNLNQTVNGKYAEINVNGSNNSLTVSQLDAGGKSAFLGIGSSNNTVNITQQGTGNHFVEVDSNYGSANVSITQSGSAQKLFQLILNNPGIGVTVQQTNATTSDSAKMEITCSTPPCTGYTYTKN